jgi:radical SAM/Cys-rich protein
MHATLPLLAQTDFPQLYRRGVETIQVNLGYRCNQSCLHCHVNAGPQRQEEMSAGTIAALLELIDVSPKIRVLDLTGGAPELNPNFRSLVVAARRRGLSVIDRCNLTILEEPGFDDLAAFLAEQRVEIVASLPCYLEENVDRQRGRGSFAASIRGLLRLNALGYGGGDGALTLNLVFNPQGASLPPAQGPLEAAYRAHLAENFGVVFDRLFTLVNMPIQRFGSTLVSKGQFDSYMQLLRSAHRDENLGQLMCLDLISVDWQGYLYDCDFNQQLGLPMAGSARPRRHITELTEAANDDALAGNPVRVADHCYGCTAGQGSSCGGALAGETAEAP